MVRGISYAMIVGLAASACGADRNYAAGNRGTATVFDSRWGQEKTAQQHKAAAATPGGLTADGHALPTKARTVRLRAYVTKTFTAHVVDAPKHVRGLLDDANRVSEPALGVRFELESLRVWDLGSDEDLVKALEALAEKDRGEDVDWVAGFVGAIPRATRSFHDLGRGALPGKHLVLRAPGSYELSDAVEKAFDELSDDDRRKVRVSIRRHRSAVSFLHEIGHTLGVVHETSKKSVMYPAYDRDVSSFGPESLDVMRAALDARAKNAAPAESAHAIEEALKRAPSGVFVDQERTAMVGRLAQIAAPPKHVQPTADDAAPPVAQPPETPELAAADRERFVKAWESMTQARLVAAWETAKPLFSAYPGSMPVQDLRCRIATSSMPFAVARRECEALMNLATGNGQK